MGRISNVCCGFLKFNWTNLFCFVFFNLECCYFSVCVTFHRLSHMQTCRGRSTPTCCGLQGPRCISLATVCRATPHVTNTCCQQRSGARSLTQNQLLPPVWIFCLSELQTAQSPLMSSSWPLLKRQQKATRPAAPPFPRPINRARRLIFFCRHHLGRSRKPPKLSPVSLTCSRRPSPSNPVNWSRRPPLPRLSLVPSGPLWGR